ncbi:hypothetical protein JMN32_21055 [Fulvivirga sp. 29W222]|uniref:Bulb-type lectin domain-containing protein n=1 Tax=Fulvivirga marina TaxID=2494733 RepID=A0A937FZD8_9BACT|nr:hypothetical protein [Fulvivirga marina]MBL6448814.1 hypothetical protein [Fulvivirga marina]
MKSSFNICNITIALSLFAILACVSCEVDPFAEPDDSGQFIKFFGEVNDENGYAAIEADNGDFIFTGSTNSTEDGSTNILIAKADVNGNRVWQKQVEQPLNQTSKDIELLSNGDAFIFGHTTLSNGTTDFLLLHINSEGEEVASFTYGDSTKNEEGLGLIPSVSGGYLLIGTIENNASDKDMLITKVDDSGNEIFSNTYGLIDEFDAVTSVVENEAGELVWCGTLNRNGTQSMRVVSTDSLGSLIWDYTYQEEINNSQSVASDMKKITGGYIITGKSFTNSGESNVLLVNISDKGTFKWAADLTSTFSQEGNSVARTSDGGYTVVGKILTTAGTSDIYLLKTNSLGQLLWSKTFGGEYDDSGNFVKESSDRGLIILGTAKVNNNNVIEFIKTDADGNTPGDGGEK